MTDLTLEQYDALTAAQKVEYMADKASAAFLAGRYSRRCILGEPVFYVENAKALVAGHIYSENGAEEFEISGMCEYHFDKAFAEDSE